MQRFMTLVCVLALSNCETRPMKPEQIAAAAFTEKHTKHKLQATAAGRDCRVLLVATETRFNDDLVEKIHYGGGDYSAFGGVEEFSRARGFRAVVYRDPAGGLWTYGGTTRDEAGSLPRCR